jgi:lantibiotic biosynthesis protein
MNSAPGPWVPLLQGTDASEAIAGAEAIARDLASAGTQESVGLSLSAGLAGLALFFDYLERSLGQAAAGGWAERSLDQAITQLARHPAPGPSLFHGYVGVAWVAEHLGRGEQSLEEEDPNEEIDQALLSILRRAPWQGGFDLLGGLVGWGVYALERLPRPAAATMLPLILERLAACAERGASGIHWRDPSNAALEPDAGMAHGAAGVIAFLARTLQEGAAGPAAASLLTAAVAGVLDRAGVEEDATHGDLAWCAGDAGLAVALLAAGRACGREEWERGALRLASAAATRFPEDTGGLDPALCHGTAGLSHLFHRLFQWTGDPALLAAARRWLERTLARRRPGKGVGGFSRRGRARDGRQQWTADPGFLGGAAGIGLALLAAATPVEPEWDRLLLLSGRHRQESTRPCP